MMKPCQTLFKKKKAPKKGREKEARKGQGPKFRQAKSPTKEAGHKEVKEPLSTLKTSKWHSS
jgi:hypothetical protein